MTGGFLAATGKSSRFVDWRRPRDRNMFLAACTGLIFTYFGVWWTEEQQKYRRHQSIEKDIERERWRAAQLGLGSPNDDGFAEAYVELERKKRREQGLPEPTKKF